MRTLCYIKSALTLCAILAFAAAKGQQCNVTDNFANAPTLGYTTASTTAEDGWIYRRCQHTAGDDFVIINGGGGSYVGSVATTTINGGCSQIKFKYQTSLGTKLTISITQSGSTVFTQDYTVANTSSQYVDAVIDVGQAGSSAVDGDYVITIRNSSAGTSGSNQKVVYIQNLCVVDNYPPAPPIPAHTYAITAPVDASVFVGDKHVGVEVMGNYLKMHYIPFREDTAVAVTATSALKTWYYNAAGDRNYRISSEAGVTHAGIFRPREGIDTALTFTAADLALYGKKEIDHDVNHLGGRNVADVFMNINAQGHLKLAAGDTFQLIHTRNWQAINNDVDNYFIEPDFHYRIVGESGAESSDVVSISSKGLLRAVGSGTAFVLVDYDAMVTHHTNNVGGVPALFSALCAENTGVFAVSVDAQPSGITANMHVSPYWAKDGTDRTDSIAIDAEMDVLYYPAGEGSFRYRFAPMGVSDVQMAKPMLSDALTSYNGFNTDSVSSNGDGTYTLRLARGRNIVKLISSTGAAEYQVITAKPVAYSVSNVTHPNDYFRAGDEVSVVFNTLYHPCNKMAGIYNMSAGIQYTGFETNFPLILGPGQYTFASRAQEYKITIPASYTGSDFTLSNGVIKVNGFGSFYGEHRNITTKNGVPPNLNASVRLAYFGALPDICIAVPDLVKPTAPARIRAIATNLTAALIWTPATDNVGVTEYRIYLDGTYIGATADTNYTVTGLLANTSYSAYIKAFDRAGNASDSIAVLFRTLDASAPTMPMNLTAVQRSEFEIVIRWNASTDDVGVALYNIHVGGVDTAYTTDTIYRITGLALNTEYMIEVWAVDMQGNSSAIAQIYAATTPDITPPTTPAGLTEIAAENMVVLSWAASTDNVGVLGYIVYLDGDSVNTTIVTTHTLTGLQKATSYTLAVQAFDRAGNRSAKAQKAVRTSGTTSIDAQQQAAKLHPNPATEMLYIDELIDGNVEIYDIAGALMLTTTSAAINISHLKSGVYVVKVNGNASKVVKR